MIYCALFVLNCVNLESEKSGDVSIRRSCEGALLLPCTTVDFDSQKRSTKFRFDWFTVRSLLDQKRKSKFWVSWRNEYWNSHLKPSVSLSMTDFSPSTFVFCKYLVSSLSEADRFDGF